jgi:hypothetical protein
MLEGQAHVPLAAEHVQHAAARGVLVEMAIEGRPSQRTTTDLAPP